MRLGIDIDGVCADFFSRMFNYIKVANPTAKKEDIKDYSFESLGFDKEMLKEVMKHWEKTGDYITLDVIPGSVGGVNKLSRHNDIYMISSRDQFPRIH